MAAKLFNEGKLCMQSRNHDKSSISELTFGIFIHFAFESRLRMSVQERNFIKMLQEANRRNDDLLERLTEAVNQYHELYKDQNRLQSQLFCESCQKDEQSTKEGKTFVLCDKCKDKITDWKKRVKKLEEEVNYWKQCYESAVEDICHW